MIWVDIAMVGEIAEKPMEKIHLNSPLSATTSPSPAPTAPYNQLCRDLASPTSPKARSPPPYYSSATAHLPIPPEPSDSAVPAAKPSHIPVPAPPAKIPEKLRSRRFLLVLAAQTAAEQTHNTKNRRTTKRNH
jgi:hypothetical protein